MLKPCKVCSEWTDVNLFRPGRNICKKCTRLQRSVYLTNNKELVLATYKKYCERNRLRIKKNLKEYKIKTKKDRDAYAKGYVEKNKDLINERKKRYRALNKDKIGEYSKQYNKKRKSVDPVYKLRCYMRSRLWFIFKKKVGGKSLSTQVIIGCDYDFLRSHIEKQFKDDMNWANYGRWHVDHIIPLASAKTIDQLLSLCHYSNLQPLWEVENLRKSAKMEWPVTAKK